MNDGGLTCERCGSFTETRERLGPRELCPQCVSRVALDARFYSHLYVLLVGLLLNPTTMMVLLSVNYRRLGDVQKARSMLTGAVVVGVAYAAYVLSPIDLPNGIGLGVGVALTVVLTRPYRPVWVRLEALGARRANRVWPVALSVAVLAVVVGVAIAVELRNPQGAE